MPYDKARTIQVAKFLWGESFDGFGVSPTELHENRIMSAEDAVNAGYDLTTLTPLRPGSHFYYQPKESPVPKLKQKRVRKAKEVQYRTVGVRFLEGQNLAKVYTYRVPQKAKLHLGQEVVVPTDKTGSGYITRAVAVVVELHAKKQDNCGYDYKFVTGTIKPL